jgi:hypothetical protein
MLLHFIEGRRYMDRMVWNITIIDGVLVGDLKTDRYLFQVTNQVFHKSRER